MKLFTAITITLSLTLSQQSATAGEADSSSKSAQILMVGLRFQKAAGFYWSNGVSVEYCSQKIFKQQISLGFNLISSRLGTALNSNAIPLYEMDISGIKYFRRSKPLKPLLRLNLGYAHANYGSDNFNDLADQSFLVSLEGGAVYDLKFPLRVALSGGYNLITGNGESGLGVIYPFYAQVSILFRILPKS